MRRIEFTPNKNAILVFMIIIALILLLTINKQNPVSNALQQGIDFLKEKTWDVISDRRINTLHPIIRAKAKEFIIRAKKELGIKLRVTSAMRTWQEQQRLYNQGRTTSGKIVTNAKAGQSYHNYGLALDVVEIKNGKALWQNPNWDKIGQLGKSLGFEWGGDWKSFKDRPHFQMTFGVGTAQLAQNYQQGNLKNGYILLS